MKYNLQPTCKRQKVVDECEKVVDECKKASTKIFQVKFTCVQLAKPGNKGNNNSIAITIK